VFNLGHHVGTLMSFSVRGGRKVSKCEAIFRSPRTEKKSMQTLLSVRADGNLCAPSAIFHPQRQKTK